ncbi:hypothetical protein E1265_03655 [Streptomyces sp. 8K308]|uniref:hypothetical protein n=1 Tax=Streptomyces sp. 8K308 TaxID=2530388 RepID=UPI00104AE900|nr:hypothetical protein [Streptomyces sp. 8K308]TDC26664.1 hypothetical protein E1265_03655 [Streptomyces sp. 8K308]
MLPASEIGLRLGVAAAGVGSVVLAGHADDPVTGSLAVLSAVVFLGPLVVLLVADVREWRGHRAPEPDPTGRPRAAEWIFVVVFDGVLACFGYAGVLDLRRGGSGELLVTALMVGVVVLFLNIEFLGRWWRHRRTRG